MNERHSKIIDPRLGEIRRNDFGDVEFIVEVEGYVAVWQVGTDHDPFFMPLKEWNNLPKVEK